MLRGLSTLPQPSQALPMDRGLLHQHQSPHVIAIGLIERDHLGDQEHHVLMRNQAEQP